MTEKHNTPFDYDYHEFTANGEWAYFKTIQIGGKDEHGFFEIVQDGPAEGERGYYG